MCYIESCARDYYLVTGANVRLLLKESGYKISLSVKLLVPLDHFIESWWDFDQSRSIIQCLCASCAMEITLSVKVLFKELAYVIT